MSESEPVSLAAHRNAAVPEVVATLEGMLAKARSGELRGVVVLALSAEIDYTVWEVSEVSLFARSRLVLLAEGVKMDILTESAEGFKYDDDDEADGDDDDDDQTDDQGDPDD